MKYLALLPLLSFFAFCSNSPTISNNKKPDLNVEFSLKGSYNLSKSDSSYYYLVDLKLTNNSDSTIEFWTLSCSFSFNLVSESPDFKIMSNDCFKNVPRLIKLKPKESLIAPTILQTYIEKPNIDKKLSIGFVYIDSNTLRDYDIFQLLINFKKKNEHIFWSHPVFLYKGTGQPYRIDCIK